MPNVVWYGSMITDISASSGASVVPIRLAAVPPIGGYTHPEAVAIAMIPSSVGCHVEVWVKKCVGEVAIVPSKSGVKEVIASCDG